MTFLGKADFLGDDIFTSVKPKTNKETHIKLLSKLLKRKEKSFEKNTTLLAQDMTSHHRT
jgi:hypothetical protein